MTITFFIGNGFDKALGKKTGYQDFYNWLKMQPSSNNPFIEEMKKDIYGNYDKWSDFEVGLGNFTDHFTDSDEVHNALPNAITWKNEVDRLLKVYLQGEESSNSVKNIIESDRNIQELWDFLFAATVFINMGDIPAIPHKWAFYFISLNYTDFLDQIVEKVSKYQANGSFMEIHREVFHPHGKLSTQIVLGVNDSFTFKNEDLIKKPENWEFEGLMLKRSFIANNIGTLCERRCQRCIDESRIVCIYGASLGQTDKDWWDLLADWLRKDKRHLLVIFWFFTGDKKDIEQEICDIQNVFIGGLQLEGNEEKELRKRIIVYFHKREILFSSQQKQVYLLGNGIKLPMVFVEAGTFTMGKNEEDKKAKQKEHIAVLTKDFYIGETPVTQEQYMAIMGNNNNPSKNRGKNLPVEQVSWYDAMNFCAKLNKKNLAPSGYHFSLPTETQWEFAARGGKRSKGYKYSGSDNPDEVAWYGNSNSPSHPVGQKKTNELGLYDMSGNVWEWCLDDYTGDNSYAKPEFVRGANDTSSSDRRIDRGGAHDCGHELGQVASRSNYPAKDTCYSIGFRVALVPE